MEALDAVIAELDEHVVSLEREIAAVLRDSAWASSVTVLLSAPGIGLVTTAWLLVSTLNFTVAQSPEQFTAYVGLALLERQSGTSVRGRAQIGQVETTGCERHSDVGSRRSRIPPFKHSSSTGTIFRSCRYSQRFGRGS